LSLQTDYTNFWSTHSLTNAQIALSTLFNYLDIYPPYNDPNYVLQPTNLVSLYAFETNTSYADFHGTYTDLINWYENYLNNMIQQIVDTQNKTNAILAQGSFLNAIGGAVSSVFNGISDFITKTLGMPLWVFLLLLAAVAIGILFFTKRL